MRGSTAKRFSGDTDLQSLNSDDQERRLNAIYATTNARHVDDLTKRLRDLARSGMHKRRLARNKVGDPIPCDDVRRGERRWNERAIVMDDAAYALAALGESAVARLEDLLDEQDPWVLINTVFACGELGPMAFNLAPKLSYLLKHPDQAVVR